MTRFAKGQVSLERAISKLGLASRSEARALISGGRVRVGGHVVRDALAPVVPERARITIEDKSPSRVPWRTILFHKPRGVVTTRRDPEGRPTVYDALRDAGVTLPGALKPVGRLDLATSGLLLMTTDTRLADWLTDPSHGVLRRYVVTARGEISDEDADRIKLGVDVAIAGQIEHLGAVRVEVLKRSQRETHAVIELTEGKNREIRRLIEACGSEVMRLRRIGFGGLQIGHLGPGEWREITADEIQSEFPKAPVRLARSRQQAARRR
jgi:23S rRNA pseudouridine2605 synthase